MPKTRDYGMAHTVEVFCTHCGRRYLVADAKVRGRRCSAPCKCGERLLIDGRAIRRNTPPKSAALARVRLRKVSRQSHESGAETARPVSVTELPQASVATSAGEQARQMGVESEPASSAAPFALRPKAPAQTRVIAEPGLPEEPQDLGEAIARLEDRLDRAAESFRPAWESDDEPSSRQITPAGEVPEVTVHYPQHWQPPPSERQRMRKSWAGQPESAVSAPVDADASTVEAAPEESAGDVAGVGRVTTPSPVTRTLAEAGTPEAPSRELDSFPPPPIETEKLDSTAPTAISRPPPPPTTGSRAGWYAALGLAALAMLGVGRELASQSGPQSSGAAEQPAIPQTPGPQKATAHGVEVSPQAREVSAKLNAPDEPPPSDAENEELPNQPDDDEATSDQEPVSAGPAEPEPEPERSEPEQRGSSEASEKPLRAPTPDSSLAPPRLKVAKPVTEPATPTGLDPARVRAPLAAAASRARACAAPGGPNGAGTVRVLFNPEGGVLSATVLGAPFAGTETGACIERAFRSAATPSFHGRTQSTNYGFSLP